MIISKTIDSLKSALQQWRSQGLSVGLVPTMGHLHMGHISLVKSAQLQCDKVVVSLFVNPLQFNETSDYTSYPETLSEDQEKLAGIETDLLFLPDKQLMYPDGTPWTSKIVVPGHSEELEGAYRPGHFDGVATVVCKLLNMVQPQVAFFGEKDFQQLMLVRKMVTDLNMSVEIESVATQREEDGLAMSSRNSRLSVAQRSRAADLYKTLQEVGQQLTSPTSISDIENRAMDRLRSRGFEPEYISVRHCSDLQPATDQSEKWLVLAAAKLGDVRLIDNLVLD
ncbi:Pantoate--beta-alanine ligase [hydrothermal vent metagenome]|uniref:pantoate--beta-alanine ligase (AMP-forming) n=1 Tax=hydrothermal vent metagenome TaxID=652676 RepID=A0A3B0WPU3_9ZZZZ